MRLFLFFLLHIIIISAKSQITVVIESLPASTPTEDSIFIAGTFNNWALNDPDYMLRTQLDGKYAITLPIDTGIIEFKLVRGLWSKVETGATNQHMPNRRLDCSDGGVYYAKIENWQDLGGVERFNYAILWMFAIGFWGIIVSLLIFRLNLKKPQIKRASLFFNSLLVVSLIGFVIHNQSNIIWKSRIEMLSLIFLFMWGPLLWNFVNSVSKKQYQLKPYHFIPASVVVIIDILRYFNVDFLTPYSTPFQQHLLVGDTILVGLGLLSVWLYISNVVIAGFHIKKEVEKLISNRRLVEVLFLINITTLFIFTVYFVGAVFYSFKLEYGIEIALAIISSVFFVEFMYYVKYLNATEVNIHEKSTTIRVIDQEQEDDEGNDTATRSSSYLLPENVTKEIKAKLVLQMTQDKVFKDPELKVAKLSKLIETQPYILSRVINEEFNKSFRDYINEYRIKEFIELSKHEKYKHFTILALSYEVGFNSKSTFNLTFKKVTGTSPRIFLSEKQY